MSEQLELVSGASGAGSPTHGLVWAFAFDEAGRPELLADDDVPVRLSSSEGWIWLHVNLTDGRARDWISQLPLDEHAKAVLLAAEPRLQLSLRDGHIAGVVSDFNLELDRERSFEVGRLRFAMTERLIVSGRHHPLRTIERVREDLSKGRNLSDVAHVFEVIIDAFLDAAHDDLAASSDDVDDMEEAVIAGRAGAEPGRTSRIRRGLLRLRREVVHLRAALRPLEHSSPDQAPKGRLHRVVAASAPRLVGRLDALDHDIHDLQERLRLVKEEMAALATQETNRQLYILSFLTAVFLPGTFVTSMFGMNTKDLPFQQTDDGYWYAMALVVAATIAVLGFLAMNLARSGNPRDGAPQRTAKGEL